MIAKQAGNEVSGSDKQDSQYIEYLRRHGIEGIKIGQTKDQIAAIHANTPIDWYVFSSAVTIENPDAPEVKFCQENNIRTSKRDELLNQILDDKNLKLLAVAGTHGKTTTTAMVIWLFKQLRIPVSYSVGAKIPFGEMGQYQEGSEYFVYEADEFDRNFLAFTPYISLITGVAWDHHEQYPTRQDYYQAFKDFVSQSKFVFAHGEDLTKIELSAEPESIPADKFMLIGEVNRKNAQLAVEAVAQISKKSVNDLIKIMNQFPGLNRRFERIADNLYSDYAHTPEKIMGALQTAQEACARSDLAHNGGEEKKKTGVVVVYEPLTDRRQHYIKDAYHDLFHGVKKLYWVPSYLAREDPDQPVLSPSQLISHMANKDIARPAKLDDRLKDHIQKHLDAGDLVICLSGGGGGSLDEWLRKTF